MSLSQFLHRQFAQWQSRKQLAAEANQLAYRCQHQVWDRVVERVAEMSAAEARGYIRARAAAVVHQEARQSQFSAAMLLYNDLVQHATDLLVDLMLDRWATLRLVPVRTAPVAYRRAA